jgi:protein-L-isoaspartate(D-aspartate) O-methyltransferase
VGTFRSDSEDRSFSLLLFEVGDPDGSWAACDYEPDKEDYEVTQYGDRRLWDEFAAAWLRWQELGRPRADRFGITVAPQCQELWLDEPKTGIGTV